MRYYRYFRGNSIKGGSMKNSKKSILTGMICCGALFLVYPLIMVSCSKVQHFELSRFVAPDVCGGCHDAIYEQWKNSMHNLSQSDTLYRQVAFAGLKGLTHSGEIEEAEHCVVCHNPMGYVSGFPKRTSDEQQEDKIPAITKEGIQCDFCHSATGAYSVYNAKIQLDPGHGDANPGTKRGPFKDSKSDYHKSAFSEFHTQSEICGVCHDVRHVAFGTKLETTYEEWTKSPYNSSDPAKRIYCQGCHMYHRPGVPATGSTARPENPGVASVGGPERKHIFTHYFVGGNSFFPAMKGDTVKAKMAVERLQNAAELSIDDSAVSEGKLYIMVKNTGAGHYLPTGLTDVRQMWLQVVVKNAAGTVVYATGRPDSSGYLGEDTIIFNTVFGDGSGKKVSNIAKAREILSDHRVPPGKALKETITIPPGVRGQLHVEARLLYRSAPQKLVDSVMGKGKLTLPVTTMVAMKKRVNR